MLEELKTKFSLIGAVNRVAEAIEEHNRLFKQAAGLPDLEAEADWPMEPSVTVATDAATWEAEQEDERKSREY